MLADPPADPPAFAPIRTARLTIRPVRLEDAEPLAARRSDPEIALYESWQAPYPLERARSLVARDLERPAPIPDEWWSATIVEGDDGPPIGDIALRPTWGGRSVEVGYVLDRDRWGRGYAVEAVTALVARLWEDPAVTRLHAMLHPDNSASAQVLERTGFLLEGHSRLSYWVGDDNSDDLLYGMTRADHDDWVGRPTGPPAAVRLVEITPDNARAVRRLRTHASQRRFVAPVLDSLADALIPELEDGVPVVPWYRAVEADGELVGFVMLTAITDAHPDPSLWRLLVDRRHQRRGIGARTLDLVVEECRRWGATRLLVSWGEGRGTPGPFYTARGFTPTGRLVEGEVEAALDLTA